MVDEKIKLSKILRIIGLIIGLIGIGLIFANYDSCVFGLCLIIIAFIFMCFSLKMKIREIKKGVRIKCQEQKNIKE